MYAMKKCDLKVTQHQPLLNHMYNIDWHHVNPWKYACTQLVTQLVFACVAPSWLTKTRASLGPYLCEVTVIKTSPSLHIRSQMNGFVVLCDTPLSLLYVNQRRCIVVRFKSSLEYENFNETNQRLGIWTPSPLVGYMDGTFVKMEPNTPPPPLWCYTGNYVWFGWRHKRDTSTAGVQQNA